MKDEKPVTVLVVLLPRFLHDDGGVATATLAATAAATTMPERLRDGHGRQLPAVSRGRVPQQHG